MKSYVKRIEQIEQIFADRPKVESRTFRYSPVRELFEGSGEATAAERSEFDSQIAERGREELAYYEKHRKPMVGSWADTIMRYRIPSVLFKVLGLDAPGFDMAQKFCK